MLTKEQLDGVIDIVGVQFESLLSNDNDITSEKPSDPIVQSVDINPTPTSYAGAAEASTIGQSKVNSNFRTLVVEPKFDDVNISIRRKVVEKEKHGLTRIMVNSKGFFFFKFKSQAGLKAVLDGGPWLICKSPIILKKWSMETRLLKEELTRISIWVKLHDGQSSFAWCLIKVNSEADLVDVVTIGIPSLTGEYFTKETIRVDYEWRPPRCDVCKIFGHVHDQCPKKVVSPSIVATSTIVTPTVELSNNGFQMVGKKKKKGKPKSTNGSQFVRSSVKHNVKYKPKAATSQPKKIATTVGNTSKLSSKSKSYGTSSKQGNVTTSNSYSALENDENEDEEHVEIFYDESANLFPKSRVGERSSFTTGAG
nr:zinc knuckle CX2CX4HX4C [Tanacetum cinerariifolium]